MKLSVMLSLLTVASVSYAQTTKTPSGGGGGSGSGQVIYTRNGTATPVSQDTVTPTNSRPLPVTNFNTSGVPVDPATSQLQTTGNTSLSSLDAKTPALVGGRQPVDGSGVTQPVSQVGGPWSQNLTQLAGTAFSASNFLPARITNGTSYIDPTLIRALTSADVVSAVQSGTWTVAVSNALALASQFPSTLGGKTSANSLSIVPATDATFPISATSLPLPAGAATSALQTTGNTSLGNIDTKTPALGQTTMAGSRPVAIAANQSAIPVTTGPAAAVSVTSAAVTVGTTAVRLVSSGTTPASTRRKLAFVASTQNTGNCYFGGSAVAVANGLYAFPGAITTYDNDVNDYFAICDTASQVFFVMEDK